MFGKKERKRISLRRDYIGDYIGYLDNAALRTLMGAAMQLCLGKQGPHGRPGGTHTHGMGRRTGCGLWSLQASKLRLSTPTTSPSTTGGTSRSRAPC